MSESAKSGRSRCPFCHQTVHLTTHFPCSEQPVDPLTGENANAKTEPERPPEPAGESTSFAEVGNWMKDQIAVGESVEMTSREIAIELGASTQGVGAVLGNFEPAIGRFKVESVGIGYSSTKWRIERCERRVRL